MKWMELHFLKVGGYQTNWRLLNIDGHEERRAAHLNTLKLRYQREVAKLHIYDCWTR